MLARIGIIALTVLCIVCTCTGQGWADDENGLTEQKKTELLARTAGTWKSLKGRKDVACLIMDGKGAYEAKDAAGKIRYKGSLEVSEEMEDVFVYSLLDEKGKEVDGDFSMFTVEEKGNELHFGNDDGFEYSRKKQ